MQLLSFLDLYRGFRFDFFDLSLQLFNGDLEKIINGDLLTLDLQGDCEAILRGGIGIVVPSFMADYGDAEVLGGRIRFDDGPILLDRAAVPAGTSNKPVAALLVKGPW